MKSNQPRLITHKFKEINEYLSDLPTINFEVLDDKTCTNLKLRSGHLNKTT